MGPKARSTMLSKAEEAIVVVEFRRRTLLPLDDVLGCRRDTIPKLTRSALQRCLLRHGSAVSCRQARLPRDEKANSEREAFKETKIGYVHIDSAQFRFAEGKVHMFLAIDRVSEFVHVEFHPTAEMATGAAFMRDVFDCACDEHGIGHRLTKPYHPWTNGHAERMNRTISSQDQTNAWFRSERNITSS
jgi:hypothetical protein